VCWVGSISWWVGLDRVTQSGHMDNSGELLRCFFIWIAKRFELRKYLYLRLLVNFVKLGSSSIIVQGPRNRTVVSKDAVNFSCTSDKTSDIYWYYIGPQTADGSCLLIFNYRGRNEKCFGERFVKTVNNFTSVLTIHDVLKSDAGTYFCGESTSNTGWLARLTVTG